MSSFRDIALNVIEPHTVLGSSMRRINVNRHEEIALQMAEWEKKNKVNVIPIGVSGEYDPIAAKIVAASNRANHRSKGALEIKRTKRSLSGHQNLKQQKDGWKVSVAGVDLGVYSKEEALKVRDAYRVKHNMPQADY